MGEEVLLMLDEIKNNLRNKVNFDEYENVHLGIFTEPCLSYMLEGKKTIESRFSKHRIAPFNKIGKNDIVIVKKSGGKVVAYFTIKDILFFDFTIDDFDKVKEKYNKDLCVSDEFWEEKKNSRYATLIFIDKIVIVDSFKINKRGMQTWICLEDN